MALTTYTVGLDLMVDPSKDKEGESPRLKQIFLKVQAETESKAIRIANNDPSFTQSVYDSWIEDEETECLLETK